MQEIKKQSIVIASILKPVDDTRMFEKMGMSLNATGLWNVHLIGFGELKKSGSISFHPLGNFKRISWERLFARIGVLLKLVRIRPKVVIINTHELLGALVIYSIFFRCRSIYDITENYYLNILHTDTFPRYLRRIVAYWVRLKEWGTSSFVDHFLLAERSYESELPFIKTRFTIIENKCKLPEGHIRNPVKGKIRLLFTGTLDTSTGIFESISFFKSIQKITPEVELRIAGYCAINSVREKILKEIQGLSGVSYSGLTHLVGHNKIMKEISEATAGLVYYPPSKHTLNRIPTKVYEYLAARLPIIYDQSATWSNLVERHNAGIKIDFSGVNPKEIIDLLQQQFNSEPIAQAMWEAEVPRFLSVVNSK